MEEPEFSENISTRLLESLVWKPSSGNPRQNLKAGVSQLKQEGIYPHGRPAKQHNYKNSLAGLQP